MKQKLTFLGGIVFLFLIVALPASSQILSEKDQLMKISQDQANMFSSKKAEAVAYAQSHGIPVSFTTPDGQFVEIQYIDEFGKPQYYVTENANSAATISTNQVYAGGSAGLSLTGAGITLRLWDAGAVRTTHQELTGRVVMGDGATTLHYHSTHVAGTLIASGVLSQAKGMAPAGQIRAFDWNSDASEMAAEAANGSLISSHSYGYVRGWSYMGASWTWFGNVNISTQEDYLFGFYDSQAASWDNIARNAPYYLICKSAGNDRNEGPTSGPYPKDGPYDCIAHAAIGKNIMTVGAVYDLASGYNGPSSVVMSSFSCWGPADDGRIKPDIVANGISLTSTDCDNDADYATLSGTSMATPSVAGSLALLQEHWHNLHPSSYMRSSTLKGLVIHTADECGTNDGPDYEFGWGLMNTENAALKISEDLETNVIDEITLNNGGTYTRSIDSYGTEPLKVTICWTDPAGTPVSAQLDPSNPMLVNDLDLRITNGGNTYYPWKLDRDNPTAAATHNSENNVDNVEVVYIAAPTAGTYTIIVDHDGTLSGGSQVFSIIISGITDVTPDPPVANFIANDTTPETTQVVTFTDLSTNNPTSWSWSFTPGSVTYLNGTSATSQNPEVTFDAVGTYTASLIATNVAGSNQMTAIDYITASIPLPDPPICTTPINPTNGAIDIDLNTSLSWNAVSDATGYKIYFGTDNPPTNIENATDLGNVTSYSPETSLNYSDQYYWKIVPYNETGDATGCAIWSFTTVGNPNFPYNESFESDFGQWTQATYDDFNWTRWSGTTTTSKTGPNKAYEGSYYIYTESSGQQTGNEACLEATFDFTSIPDPEISLWYHMYGNQMGSLHVDVYDGTWHNNIWYKSGQQHSSQSKPFSNAIVSLATWANQSNITIRIRGTRGSGERSDMAVDYVTVGQQGTYNPKARNKNHDFDAGLKDNLLTRNYENSDIDFYTSNGIVYLRNSGDDQLKANVQVYNLTGQMVRSFIVGGTGDFQISTGLNTGLYIVRIDTGDSVVAKKILIP